MKLYNKQPQLNQCSNTHDEEKTIERNQLQENSNVILNPNA